MKTIRICVLCSPNIAQKAICHRGLDLTLHGRPPPPYSWDRHINFCGCPLSMQANIKTHCNSQADEIPIWNILVGCALVWMEFVWKLPFHIDNANIDYSMILLIFLWFLPRSTRTHTQKGFMWSAVFYSVLENAIFSKLIL